MIDELIAAGNHALGVLGYTDHSKAHAAKVAETAGKILKELGYDDHDRVNYAAIESKVTISKEKQTVVLDITLDETICSVLEYFEIFLNRMLMCRRAAEMLNVKFKFMTNGNKVY